MTGGPVPRGECASPVRCDADGEQKIKPSTVRPWPLHRDPNSRRLAGPCGADTEPAGAATEHPGRVAFVLVVVADQNLIHLALGNPEVGTTLIGPGVVIRLHNPR